MKGKRFTQAKIAGLAGFCAFLVLISAAAWQISASHQPNLGDLNLDRDIDVCDAVMLARYVGQDTELVITDEGIQNADVNESGSVNQDDCVALLTFIAHLVDDISELSVKPKVTETTAATETTSETTETTVTTTETTVTTTETTPVSPRSHDGELTLETRTFPVGKSLSVLTGQEQPDEQLTVQYEAGNMIFAIYGKDAKNTFISIALNDEIVGYYGICESYTMPEGYTATEYIDTHPEQGTGRMYAVLVLRDDCSIDFRKMVNKNDFTFMSRINFYALNGLRALNGVTPLEWSGQSAYTALQHSIEMADNNFCGHDSLDGTKYCDRLERAGIYWGVYGENVVAGQMDPFAAIHAWYISYPQKHRSTMLNPKLTHVGIAFAYNDASDCKVYGSQDYYALT